MDQYKQAFIDFLIGSGALKLSNPNDPGGLFTLKSGRKSPFFLNTGGLNDGEMMNKLGEAYARTIRQHFGSEIRFDVVFGPAYKGIPLSVSAVMAYANLYGISKRYSSNRKEAKDHGDVGSFIGAKLEKGDYALIIDDVTTTGDSIAEAKKIIEAAGAKPIGAVVALDRMEAASDAKDMTALEMLESRYGFPVVPIVTMKEVIEHQHDNLSNKTMLAFDNYYQRYGVAGREVL